MTEQEDAAGEKNDKSNKKLNYVTILLSQNSKSVNQHGRFEEIDAKNKQTCMGTHHQGTPESNDHSLHTEPCTTTILAKRNQPNFDQLSNVLSRILEELG